MKTQATLERNGAGLSRNGRPEFTVGRGQLDSRLTLKPVVLMVGEFGGLVFITPVAAVAGPQWVQRDEPVFKRPGRQSDDYDDRDPNNPLHWMPVPLPNTTREQF
jgi:hypothetical protein